MDDATEKKIGELMSQGLDLYGMDQTERAVSCWLQVLALDPEHPEAKDFLRTAGYEGPELGPEEQEDDQPTSLMDEALSAFRTGDVVDALVLLEILARENPDDLRVQGYIELARSHLVGVYRDRVGDGRTVLRVRMTPEEIARINLPADGGLVLSHVDGRANVKQILSDSGMDPFELLRVLSHLLDSGILEVNA